jgi:GAF domain-containing protein
VPILIEDDLIGVIGVVRTVPEPFTDEQIQLLPTFANQVAIAIVNARLLDAVERQRTELSRFISPQVAGLLSSVEGEQLLAGHRAYISVLFATCATSPPLPRRRLPRSYSSCSASTTA